MGYIFLLINIHAYIWGHFSLSAFHFGIFGIQDKNLATVKSISVWEVTLKQQKQYHTASDDKMIVVLCGSHFLQKMWKKSTSQQVML